ncbi:hypothetical protein [Streptomyces sp. NPDC058735]
MNGTNHPAAQEPGRFGRICAWIRRRSALISSALHGATCAAEPPPSA